MRRKRGSLIFSERIFIVQGIEILLSLQSSFKRNSLLSGVNNSKASVNRITQETFHNSIETKDDRILGFNRNRRYRGKQKCQSLTSRS
jgi:hypothetical protein